MKTKSRKIFLILAGLVALAVFNTNKALAYDPYLVSQTTKTATSTTRNLVESDVKYFYQELGTGLEGTIERVVFQNISTDTAGSAKVSLARCDSNATPINCTGSVFIDTITYTNTTSTAEYNLTWASPITFDPTKYYYLMFTNGSASIDMTFSGSASDLYANGACKWIDYPSAPIACGGIADMYFSLGDVPGDHIDLEFPQDDSLISNDFLAFYTRASYAYLDGEFKVRVRYGVSTGLEFYNETNATSSFPFIASNFPVSVNKSVALTAGFTYYARAELYRDSTIIASSSIHEFIILDPSDGTIGYIDEQPFTDDIASLFPSDDCSAYSASIFSSSTLEALGCVSKNVFKDVLAFLFKPTELSLGFVQDTFNSFQNVFPFSIIFETKRAIEEAIETNLAGSGETLTLTAVIGAGTAQETNVSIDFYDEDILTNSLGADFKEFWYNTIIMLWIIACAYTVFNHVLHHL